MSSDDRNKGATNQAAPFARQEQGAGEDAHGDADVVRLHAEEATVLRERVETGRVGVRVVTRQHEEFIDVPLARDQVEVERISIGRQVDAIPPCRQDGDTTIVPVVEEIVVVERRLMLKEELHIRRVQITEQHQERVVLRRQEALVTRIPVESPATDRTPLVGGDGNATRKEDNHGV